MNKIEAMMPRALRQKLATMIVTALGLFLAFQYNETIKAIFETYFPNAGDSIPARIIYTLVITVIILFVTVGVEKALDGK